MKNILINALRPDLQARKKIGAFYTPVELSELMAEWAIINQSQKVLEPSFGGCGFLKSCANRFIELGADRNKLPLYGCDIDPNAFNYLFDMIGTLVSTNNFALGDFLTLVEQKHWPESFDVIIGNPPYIPYQKIEGSAQFASSLEIRRLGFNIGKQSSLWAYFVLQSLKYLKDNGRIAWVLPGSFLQANYSSDIRDFLSSKFKKIAAFQLRERVFLNEGTDERTIILLGEGFNKEGVFLKSSISLFYCHTVKDIQEGINNWGKGKNSPHHCSSPIESLLDESGKHVYTLLQNHPMHKTLGDYASIRIGLVTGNNKFFVLNDSARRMNNFRLDDLTPVLSRFSFIEGISYTLSDYRKNLSNGNPCLLVTSRNTNPRNKSLKQYLDGYPLQEIEKTATFQKRKIWCLVEDNNPPGGFFSVMHHAGPQLALNDAKINCTNSLHRVYFTSDTLKAKKKLIAITILTTYSQLSAEIKGRKYGSGVLKHEPREAERIGILMPLINPKIISTAYKQINSLLRKGRTAEANNKADALILSHMNLENYNEVLHQLKDALKSTRAERLATRNRTL